MCGDATATECEPRMAEADVLIHEVRLRLRSA